MSPSVNFIVFYKQLGFIVRQQIIELPQSKVSMYFGRETFIS